MRESNLEIDYLQCIVIWKIKLLTFGTFDVLKIMSTVDTNFKVLRI